MTSEAGSHGSLNPCSLLSSLVCALNARPPSDLMALPAFGHCFLTTLSVFPLPATLVIGLTSTLSPAHSCCCQNQHPTLSSSRDLVSLVAFCICIFDDYFRCVYIHETIDCPTLCFWKHRLQLCVMGVFVFVSLTHIISCLCAFSLLLHVCVCHGFITYIQCAFTYINTLPCRLFTMENYCRLADLSD